MKKFLKSLIMECLEEVLIKNGIGCFNKSLSKEDVNVIYIPVGRLSKSRAEEYVKELSNKFHKDYPEYKILWIPVGK